VRQSYGSSSTETIAGAAHGRRVPARAISMNEPPTRNPHVDPRSSILDEVMNRIHEVFVRDGDWFAAQRWYFSLTTQVRTLAVAQKNL